MLTGHLFRPILWWAQMSPQQIHCKISKIQPGDFWTFVWRNVGEDKKREFLLQHILKVSTLVTQLLVNILGQCSEGTQPTKKPKVIFQKREMTCGCAALWQTA